MSLDDNSGCEKKNKKKIKNKNNSGCEEMGCLVFFSSIALDTYPCIGVLLSFGCFWLRKLNPRKPSYTVSLSATSFDTIHFCVTYKISWECKLKTRNVKTQKWIYDLLHCTSHDVLTIDGDILISVWP